MTGQPNRSGGARPGAGRKPQGNQAKVKFSGTLSKEVIEFLATFQPIPRSEVIEDTIRATPEFKQWLRKQKTKKRLDK